MRNHRRILQGVALATVLAVAAAACGGDDDDDAGATTTAAAEETTTSASEGADTTAGGGEGEGTAWCDKALDDSIDAEDGAGAGWTQWVIECAAENPLQAEGEEIVIGVQNPEGDPAGTFPEYSAAAQAAADYINNELGGFGADYENGTPGRPVKIELCVMAINPADSTKCANELASKNPFVVYSTLNFFGNQFPVYQQAGVPVVVGTPISILDFTSEGVYAIGGGGGCLGVHTGLVEFVTNDLGGRRVGVPWADTPPGVTCYHDLEKKPLNILAGVTEGPEDAYGKYEGLEHIGVPIKPGQADITAQVQQVLDFDPDSIIFSAQGADCWTFVNTASRLGWNPDDVPLVLSGACLDTEQAQAAGDAAVGIYFVGTPPITQPDLLSGLLQFEAQTYLDKMEEYGAGDQATKGFATQGFNGMMVMHLVAGLTADNDPEALTQEAFIATLEATDNTHAFGSTPFGCANTDSTYKSTCASVVTATQWNGEGYTVERPNFSGVYIIEDTPIDNGS